MKLNEIKLGYEIKTGKKVEVPLAHLVVSGITSLSGKTTTIEALIKRSGLRAIIFKTKIGEAGISEGSVIPPYFKENSSWQYVQSLLEATLKERLKFERSWIIDACKNTNSLLEVKGNIDRFLADGKNAQGRPLNSLSRSIYTTLQAYFELILPQLQYASFSKTLEMRDGINIIDLEKYKIEIQSLVIRSVLECILTEHKGVIVVIPEMWKFCPQTRGNPVKQIAEEFIRQGATNKNFIWADSQDLANMDKTILKQVSVWILGLQQERNEVKHTLDQIPLRKSLKPKEDEIMTLDLGHFFVCTPDMVRKVYVQPAWMSDDEAKAVATGKKSIDGIRKPSSVAPYSVVASRREAPNFESQKFYAKVQQDLVELRQDFFTKIDEQQTAIQNAFSEINMIKSQNNMDEIVSLVLQKLPSASPSTELESLKKQIERLNGCLRSGSHTYEVAPLEKIKKDFLQEICDRITSDISTLTVEQKKVLKYMETKEQDVTPSELITKCLLLKVGGSQSTKMSNILKALVTIEVVDKTAGGRYRRGLMKRIEMLMGSHNATKDEMDSIYNHILMEMLK